MSDDDDTAILEARTAGRSVARIAREFGTTPQAVNKALDAYAVELLGEPNLRRSLMLELVRLDCMLETFFEKAINGDHAAAVICTKISQRRSCLLGLDPNQGFAVTIIGAPPQHRSSVEVSDALDHIRGICARERQLEDKETGGEPMTDQERAELTDYRAARAAKRLQNAEAELTRLRSDRLALTKPEGQPH